MKKYRVTLETGAGMTLTVEAEDEELAIEAAFEALPGDVCASCSGWGKPYSLDLGEWDVPRDWTTRKELSIEEFVIEVDD